MRKNKESLVQQAQALVKKIERNRANKFPTDKLETALKAIQDIAVTKGVNLKLYACK